MLATMRTLIPLMALFLSGCAALPNRIVLFGPVSGCSGMSEESLLASPDHLGPMTSTDDLHCAMKVARNATQQAFLKSSISSQNESSKRLNCKENSLFVSHTAAVLSFVSYARTSSMAPRIFLMFL